MKTDSGRPAETDHGAAFVISRRLQLSIVLSVVVGIGLYVAGAVVADAGEVVAKASMIRPEIWVLVVATSLVNYALRFTRWNAFIGHLGGRLPLVRHVVIYVAGFSLTTTPAKAGEGIRGVFMLRYGIPLGSSFAALFAERLQDLISIAAMSVLAAAAADDTRVTVGLAVALVGVAILFVRSELPSRLVRRVGALWPGGRVARLAAKFVSLLESSRRLLQWRLFVVGNLVGLAAWCAEALGLFILLHELNTGVSAISALGIYGASVLIGALSFLPGGLASTEAAMAGMLMAAGVAPPTAVFATIACRLMTLWFAVGLGLVALMVLAKERDADECATTDAVS